MASTSANRKRAEGRANAAASRPITVRVTVARPNNPDDPFYGFTMPRMLGRDLDALQYVYLIGTGGRDDVLKIGVANDLERRLRDLSAGNPHGLQILASRQVPRVIAFQVERKLHEHFAEQAHGREWFKVSAPEVLPVLDRLTRRGRSALRYFQRLNGIDYV